VLTSDPVPVWFPSGTDETLNMPEPSPVKSEASLSDAVSAGRERASQNTLPQPCFHGRSDGRKKSATRDAASLRKLGDERQLFTVLP